MIYLVDITNESGCSDLQVEEYQKDYVATCNVMFARAWLHRKKRPRVMNVYADETPVGIVMWLDSPDTDSYEFCQLMIDRRYQRKGYGKIAAQLVLNEMKKRASIIRFLCVMWKEMMFPGFCLNNLDL